MGFQRGNLKLEFDDPEFLGLEVKAKRFSVGELLDVQRFSTLLGSGSFDDRKEHLTELHQLLDDKILSWNYEDDEGMPVEKNLAAFAGLDEPFLEAILRGITMGSRKVAAPLERPSADTSLEESIPMEPLTDLQES